MADTVTNVVELAVGLGCLAAAAGAWRPSLPWVAALLLLAGLAAVAHAAIAFAT